MRCVCGDEIGEHEGACTRCCCTGFRPATPLEDAVRAALASHGSAVSVRRWVREDPQGLIAFCMGFCHGSYTRQTTSHVQDLEIFAELMRQIMAMVAPS